MRRYLLLLLALWASLSGIRAQNMVLNPGFESFSTCPVAAGEVTGVCDNWENSCPATIGADYFVVGCPFAPSVSEAPRSGDALMGMIGFEPIGGLREYLRGELCDDLQAGVTY